MLAAAAATASSSRPALTVTVCSVSQAPTANVSSAASTVNSAPSGTITVTVTSSVGSLLSTTV